MISNIICVLLLLIAPILVGIGLYKFAFSPISTKTFGIDDVIMGLILVATGIIVLIVVLILV